MERKVSIGWPTLSPTDEISNVAGVTVTIANVMPTMMDISLFPGMYLADDVFGNVVLCADILDGQNAPVIIDGNNVTHYPKPWVLVPATTNEYVGGHPPYVPKPPTK